MASHTVTSTSSSCTRYGVLALQEQRLCTDNGVKHTHFSFTTTSLDKKHANLKGFHSLCAPTQHAKPWTKINALRTETAVLEAEAPEVLDLAPHKLLQKGEAGAVLGIVREVIPAGLFIALPNGRDGYLPALDLGVCGGIGLLKRVFKVGQELTVRVVRHGGGGREILSMKKPEFAPNTDPRFIFSEKGGFAFSIKNNGARINSFKPLGF